MAQEFFINSQGLEDKIRQLLPSQGGAGAGFDLSASTQIIPIIDLTESAEGSNLRQDLQSAFSFNITTAFNVASATSTIINTTGYFRIFGNFNTHTKSAGADAGFILNDGASDKNLLTFNSTNAGTTLQLFFPFDFIVFLGAGDSLKATTDNPDSIIQGSFRQIADISGNLSNPT